MKNALFVALSLVVTVALAATASPARAEVRTHAAAKVSINVPDGWKIEAEEDSMTVTDPKEEVALFMHILEAKDVKAAIEAIDSEVGSSFQGVTWDDEPKTTKLNGMDAMTLDGKAKVDGKPVELGVVILATPAKKILLIVGAVEADKAKQHEKDVVALLTSIKPAR